MVASVLETAGYHYQAHVLDSLSGPFHGSLGGFIYLVGVAIAVFSVAVQGGYKFGPWLLIGPPLFFASVVPRADIGSAEWRFANQPREQEQVEKKVKDMMPSYPTTASVSKLFARYNKLVSATIQETVRLFNQEKDQTDKTFIMKAQLLSRVFAKRVDDPGLHELIQHALMGQCGRIVTAAKIVLDPGYPPDQKKAAVAALDKSTTASVDFTAELEKALGRKDNLPIPAVAKYLAGANQEIAGGGSSDPNEQAAQQSIVSSVGSPLPTTPEEVMRRPLSCQDIWQYVYLGISKTARRNIERMEDDINFNKLNVANALKELAKALGLVGPEGANAANVEQAELVEKLARASAKYILRNEADRGGFAGRIQEVANMSREFNVVQTPLEPTQFEAEFARGRSSEFSERTRLLTTASNLPYYQGLLLYFLSIAFPFFAMLLLVPGKHAGFLMWFVLWLWVKSWDIGFAVVMQLDDILFSIMNQVGLARTSKIDVQELQPAFQTAMVALRLSDPTFQITTYYNIIAASLAAIPVVSSQLILGSLSGGAGIVSAGVKAMSEDLSAGAKKAASQLAVSNMRHDMMELALARSSIYFQNRTGFSAARIDPGTGRTVRDKMHDKPMAGDWQRAHQRMHTQFTPNEGGGIVDRRPALRHNIDYAKAAAVITGLAEGVRNSGKTGGYTRKIFGGPVSSAATSSLSTAIVRGVAGGDNAAGGIAGIAAAFGKYEGTAAEMQIDPIAKRALFDAVYSDRGQKFAALARIYEMLEVPWSMDTSELADQDFERKFIEMEAEIDASVVESLTGSTTGFADYLGGLSEK